MSGFARVLLSFAAFVFLAPASVRAGPTVDPSGHWEGAIEIPDRKIVIELDLMKNAKGQLAGTIGNPERGERGLPVATVGVAGRSVTVVVKATSGGGTFHGVVADDGASMSGDFVTTEGEHSLPFRLTRTGAAKITPPPRSSRIARYLEGSWTGTLRVEGKEETLVLAMANQPDGTAAGTLSASGLTIPVSMTEKAARLHVDVPSVGGSYDGVLNDARTELTGTWTQKSVKLPLTLRRAAK